MTSALTVTNLDTLLGIVPNLRRFIQIIVCVLDAVSQVISSLNALSRTRGLRKVNVDTNPVVIITRRGSTNIKKRRLRF